jgi:pyrimidine-specific ribonucleoside hydrolase
VLIDCDPGIDDAVTLAVAANSPEIELVGVTTVAGNASLELTTANALALLSLLGRGDVPVSAGASRGLVRVKAAHADVHGVGGLGGVALPPSPRAAEPGHAVEFLATRLSAAPARSLSILAIGPLTNLALLLALHPGLTERIDRVVVMGASTGPGNMTPAAEYNVWADPEAAQRVLTDPGLEVCLVQLQVTRRATLDPAARAALRTGSALGASLSAMIDGYADDALGERALHDLAALAAILDPSLIATRPARIEVVTDSSPRRGETIISFDPVPAGANLHVAVDLDTRRLRQLLLDRIAGADQPVHD